MSINVSVRNVDWINSGVSNNILNIGVSDEFIQDEHYVWPAENYLHQIISEALEEDENEFPMSFEWCYQGYPERWFKVREGATQADFS